MSRVSGGQIERVAEVCNRILAWRNVAPFPGQSLAALLNWNEPVIGVSVQCFSDSPETVYVGNVHGQHREIPAGAAQSLPSQGLGDVYVMSLGGTGTFNVLVGDGRPG
jgi:hypothetical protein